MLNTVEIVNSQGNVLELPLENEATGVFLKGIEGLDPVKANLVSSGFANMDGAQYNSSRRETRNPRIKLGLDPDYSKETIRTLRSEIYRFFMPKTEILLRFRVFNEFDPNIISQNLVVEIKGRIETCETPIFAKDPEVDISVVCFDPDFKDPAPVVFAGVSTSGLDEIVIDYDGTVETGFVFRLLADRDVDAFTVYHRPPDGTLRLLDFTEPLIAGDILTVNTSIGSKLVSRNRAGVDSSRLYKMTPQSNWLELQPGVNHFRVYATGAPVPYDIEYVLKYGGL